MRRPQDKEAPTEGRSVVITSKRLVLAHPTHPHRPGRLWPDHLDRQGHRSDDHRPGDRGPGHCHHRPGHYHYCPGHYHYCPGCCLYRPRPRPPWRWSRPPAGVPVQNPALTPGAVFAGVTAAQVCVSGYSASVRSVSSSEKATVFAEYHLTDVPGAYEVDHLISLELGGSNDITNLWPEPYLPRSQERTARTGSRTRCTLMYAPGG